MTDLDVGTERGMSFEERALAEEIYDAIQDSQQHSPRTIQANEFRVGVSDLGFCSERLRRSLAQEVPKRTDMLAAFIGHALGDYVEQAIMHIWPHAIRQTEVSVPLTGDFGEYNLTGHPDIVNPDGLLLDVKTDRGLQVIRRTGASKQQRFQRHLYAKGAALADLFRVPLDEVQVANVWLDRAADEHELHVEMEPYSEDVVIEATEWLDEVVYNWQQDQSAPKEPPREMCEKVCGYFSTCRALDTDVEGLLTDPTVLTSVEMYQEGLALEREARKLKDQAKAHLTDVRGSTGEFAVRWIHVNAGEVAYTRKASDRLDIRKIK